MGLRTSYLGRVRVEPPLSPDEADFLHAFNATRHCGSTGPLDVAEHPLDNEAVPEGVGYNDAAPKMPGLWCPWTCCPDGCCLRWDGVEKPYAPQLWLAYLIDTFLRPGAALPDDAAARQRGLTFDHVLNGMVVGERAETAELFALQVRNNKVVRRTLVPPLEGVNEWGYGSDEQERQGRAERLAARRARYAAAIAEDLRRTG